MALLAWAIVQGAASMTYVWQWHRVPQFLIRQVNGEYYLGALPRGLLVTLEISALAFILCVILGLVSAMLRLSASPVGRAVSRAYMESIRNTPLLVQIYLVYFVLGPILDIDRFAAGVLSLALFEGAFASEIFRAGILSIPRGQWEAAAAVGLSRAQTYRLVVLPQAVRIMLPPLTGLAVSLVKHSAIVSVIAIFELATEARNAISDTFLTFEIWLVTAAIYLIVTTTMSGLVTLFERRIARTRS